MADQPASDALRKKYLAERDRRLSRDRGNYTLLDGELAERFDRDPWAETDGAREPVVREVEVAIAGGGFAGLIAGANLRRHGLAPEDICIVRYIGMSTSVDDQYAAQMEGMRKYPLDFIQVDYSLGNRGAADAIIPLAQQRKMAVLVNMPFGGRRGAASVFAKVKDRPLPDWAATIDANSWAQIFLKYVVSHPGVTVAIPGTTKVAHVIDNQGGGRGRLPDAAMRGEMERYWDRLA